MKPKTPRTLLNATHVATYITDDILSEIERISQKYRVSRSSVLRKILTTLVENNLVDQYMRD